MMNTYRTCKICGRRYRACPSCESVQTFTAWRTLTCNSREFMVFTALSDYDLHKDAQRTMQEFKNIKLTKKEVKQFLPEIQTLINKIESEATVTTKQADVEESEKKSDEA